LNSSTSVAASEASNAEKIALDLNIESVTNLTVQLGPMIASLVLPESHIRLPEIPLPTFDGRLKNWPDFRDRFHTLVDWKTNLSNIEKLYYLLRCLQAGPTDVVKGITVSKATYYLA